MTRHARDEDARAEYARDERDLRAAGYRRIRAPDGGWVWILRMNHETKETPND